MEMPFCLITDELNRLNCVRDEKKGNYNFQKKTLIKSKAPTHTHTIMSSSIKLTLLMIEFNAKQDYKQHIRLERERIN